MNSLDLSEVFTKEGVAKLKVNQLLRFNYENSVNEYIITKLNKKSGKVWARPTTTTLPNEAVIEDSLGNKEAFSTEGMESE